MMSRYETGIGKDTSNRVFVEYNTSLKHTLGLSMSTSSTRFVLLSAVFGLLGVASGAFGAHALKTMLPEDLLAIFETGSRYCLHHSMALLATSLYNHHKPTPSLWLNRSCWCFTIGISIFSGTLWILALSGVRWLGAITPIGGLSLMAGWGCILMFSIKSSRENQ